MDKKRSVPRKHGRPPAPKNAYNYGADSMLHCYNASEWRLEDWFSRDEKPQPPPKSSKSPPRK